jgi:hypothetical protein
VVFKDSRRILGIRRLDAGGKARLTIFTLHVGMHSITAAYVGSADFTRSVSTPINQIVEHRRGSPSEGAPGQLPNLGVYTPASLSASVPAEHPITPDRPPGREDSTCLPPGSPQPTAPAASFSKALLRHTPADAEWLSGLAATDIDRFFVADSLE